jgi:hypothetical protein
MRVAVLPKFEKRDNRFFSLVQAIISNANIKPFQGDTMTNHYAAPQSDVTDVSKANAGGISQAMIDAMRGTKPWVLMIGIVLLIGAVFLIFGAIGVFVSATIGMMATGPQAGVLLGVGVGYALMSVIYITLAVYLMKYSTAIGRLLQHASVFDMEEALHSQRKFWKLAGILTALMIGLFVLGMLAAILVPIFLR